MKQLFNTLQSIERQRQRYERQLYQQFNFNHADVRLLEFLRTTAQTLTELQQLTNLDISTLSRQLTALTRKKMLVKQADQKDQRKRYFVLTDFGKNQFMTFNQARTKMETAIFANWSAEEQQLLRVLLKRLLSSTQRLTPATDHASR
ncbi:MarR family winged helix-turn-helix transcriptional regulator [Loigolactobacillus jiayinensis]|uniref:MarR family winged helix-turn-helix transcriptional regulator n=1 Tax=Loigolactobacillus jiayinensis TaxID=2486016 RepID=A0ABW1RD37_9LACO|nr:winged helix DNA-binding protein [Loigolactobacillus jiayinensis]